MSVTNLATQCKFVRHSNAVAAGSAVITPSTGVDMVGYKGCLFVVEFGAIVSGAATSVEVHSSSDDGAVDTYALIAGTNSVVADTDDSKVVAIEVINPPERYLKCIVNRATQNATLEGITAIQWGGRVATATQAVAQVSGRRLNIGGVDAGLS